MHELEHPGRDTAHQEPAKPGPAVGADDDEVRALPSGEAEDALGGGAFYQLSFDVDVGALRPGDGGGEAPLGVATRPGLELDPARRPLSSDEGGGGHQDVEHEETRPFLPRELDGHRKGGTGGAREVRRVKDLAQGLHGRILFPVQRREPR